MENAFKTWNMFFVFKLLWTICKVITQHSLGYSHLSSFKFNMPAAGLVSFKHCVLLEDENENKYLYNFETKGCDLTYNWCHIKQALFDVASKKGKTFYMEPHWPPPDRHTNYKWPPPDRHTYDRRSSRLSIKLPTLHFNLSHWMSRLCCPVAILPCVSVTGSDDEDIKRRQPCVTDFWLSSWKLPRKKRTRHFINFHLQDRR